MNFIDTIAAKKVSFKTTNIFNTLHERSSYSSMQPIKIGMFVLNKHFIWVGTHFCIVSSLFVELYLKAIMSATKHRDQYWLFIIDFLKGGPWSKAPFFSKEDWFWQSSKEFYLYEHFICKTQCGCKPINMTHLGVLMTLASAIISKCKHKAFTHTNTKHDTTWKFSQFYYPPLQMGGALQFNKF